MKVLITGTNGYIGKHLSQVSPYDVTCVNRGVCDLVNTQEVDDFFDGKHFDVVIHCAVVGGSRLYKDDDNIFYNNIQMFLNLVRNRNHFDRLIHLGSGAQRTDDGNYGFSKRIISNMIKELDDFYNIIIYGLFDENEIETRFIKSCINKCMNNKPIDVYETKTMGFFHMNDLTSVVNHYIDEYIPPKTIDCSYNLQMSLLDIAEQIREMCGSDVDINYTPSVEKEYIGKNTEYLNRIISGNFMDRLKENVNKVMGI